MAAQVLIAAVNRGYRVVATVRTEEKAEQTRGALGRYLSADKLSAISFAIVPKIEAEDAFDEFLKKNEFIAVLHTAMLTTLER
jgi:hypothetical protein